MRDSRAGVSKCRTVVCAVNGVGNQRAGIYSPSGELGGMGNGKKKLGGFGLFFNL